MRHLAIALACEGPTDLRYLGDVIEGAAQELLLAGGRGQVEIAPVTPVLVDDGVRLGNQPDKVAAEFAAQRVFADVLVVHTDGAGRAEEMAATIVTPIESRLATVAQGPSVVPLVPIRETEAWMLADPAALAAVLGADEAAIRPSEPPSRVERITDPKAELMTLVAASNVEPGRRRHRRREHRIASLYGTVGARTDLAALRRTSSFAAFERALSSVLTEKGYM